MIRLFETYFPKRTVFLRLTEAAVVTLAFVMAAILQLGFLDATIALNYERGFLKIALLVAIFVVCMYYFDLYDSLVLCNQRESVPRTVQSLGALCIIFAGIYAVFPQARLDRKTFVFGWFLAICGVLVWRWLFSVFNRALWLAEPCLILGNGPLAQLLISEMKTRPELGIRVAGQLLEPAPQPGGKGALELSEAIERKLAESRVSRIIVTLGERRGTLPVETLLRLKTQGIKIQDGAELYETLSGKIALNSLRLSWLLFSPGFQPARALLLYKRLASLIVAFVVILITLPLMGLIALAIRLNSPGAVIFRQKRIGYKGHPFTLYKFRSMYDGTEPDGNFMPVMGNDDPRITRVGRWMRTTRLDELPQLFNILLGDMHLVGPRPFVPNQEEECVREIPFYQQRWTVPPGATGWAQVNRDYCATIEDNADKLAYDLFYIKNLSAGLDILILFKTLKLLLLSRGGR